jgi:hypothetical protein
MAKKYRDVRRALRDNGFSASGVVGSNPDLIPVLVAGRTLARGVARLAPASPGADAGETRSGREPKQAPGFTPSRPFRSRLRSTRPARALYGHGNDRKRDSMALITGKRARFRARIGSGYLSPSSSRPRRRLTEVLTGPEAITVIRVCSRTPSKASGDSSSELARG